MTQMPFQDIKDIAFAKTLLSLNQLNYPLKNENQYKINYQKRQKNSLTQDDHKQVWTKQEQQLLFKLHNQYGNKWAIIAQHLKGKSDNGVKNHFYSRLRKALRKLNKIILGQFKKTFKQFKIIDLYKVIEASDEKFKQVKAQLSEMADIGLNLKNRLFFFAEEEQQISEEYLLKIKSLIIDLHSFSSQYKRKVKKKQTLLSNGPQIKNNQIQKFINEESIDQNQSLQNEQKQENSLSLMQYQNIRQNSRRMRQFLKSNTNKLFEQKTSSKKRNKNKNFEEKRLEISYSDFSDSQNDIKNESLSSIKEQKLDSFAQNILKSFKSFYSFESIKSNRMIEDKQNQD